MPLETYRVILTRTFANSPPAPQRREGVESLKVGHSRFLSEGNSKSKWSKSPKNPENGSEDISNDEADSLSDGKGRFSPTSSHLFKLILPLEKLRLGKPRSEPPTVFLLHPSQPLSHISRLIAVSLTPDDYQSIFFRSMSPRGRRLQWSDSTDVGDFIRHAARATEFEIYIDEQRSLQVEVPTFADRTRFLRRRLERVQRELTSMEELKHRCDEEAHQGARRMAVGGFGMLVVYWGTVARLTFWDLGWDIMEPVTYLSGLSMVILGYLWFLYQGREVSYSSVLDRSISTRRQALYKAHGFDIERWVDLLGEARATRKEISLIAEDYDERRWKEREDEEGTDHQDLEELKKSLAEEKTKSSESRKSWCTHNSRRPSLQTSNVLVTQTLRQDLLYTRYPLVKRFTSISSLDTRLFIQISSRTYCADRSNMHSVYIGHGQTLWSASETAVLVAKGVPKLHTGAIGSVRAMADARAPAAPTPSSYLHSKNKMAIGTTQTLPSIPHYVPATPTTADSRSRPAVDWADLAVIDLSKAKDEEGVKALAAQARDAMREQGFFYVINHGYTSPQKNRIFDIADVPFSLVDESEKRQYVGKMLQGSFIGYKPRQYWHVDGGVPDEVENFNPVHHRNLLTTPQPEAVRPLLPELSAFARHNHLTVLHGVLRLLALGLELPEDAFTKTHGFDTDNESYVRFMKYHPRPEDAEEKAHHTWLKGHTDFGSITILWSQPVSALQILSPDGKWRWIKHVDNALVRPI
ncbi:hypothetical protein NM688_g6592 [Phlebia brevispora]|uniref:Uncharacterized protein n=1 Tax=Phlebia brevispora TaxID=194682 RepID=A0ACC1SED2_9APHY|nr:hypothetical protein NM688_g6592 [Phlebia brevispora]